MPSLSRPRSASIHPMATRSTSLTNLSRPTTRSVSALLRANATSTTTSTKSSSISARRTSGARSNPPQRRFSSPLSSPPSSPVPKTPTRDTNTSLHLWSSPLTSAPPTPEPKHDATIMDVVFQSPTRSCSAMSAFSNYIQEDGGVTQSIVKEHGQEGGVADTDGGDGKVVWRAEAAGGEEDDADLQGAPGSPVEHTQSLAPPQYDAAYIEAYLKSVQSAPTFEQPEWRSVPSQGKRGYQSRSRRSIL